MAIEIVDLPVLNMVIFHRFLVCENQRVIPMKPWFLHVETPPSPSVVWVFYVAMQVRWNSLQVFPQLGNVGFHLSGWWWFNGSTAVKSKAILIHVIQRSLYWLNDGVFSVGLTMSFWRFNHWCFHMATALQCVWFRAWRQAVDSADSIWGF